jgi:hypothetical protein
MRALLGRTYSAVEIVGIIECWIQEDTGEIGYGCPSLRQEAPGTCSRLQEGPGAAGKSRVSSGGGREALKSC